MNYIYGSHVIMFIYNTKTKVMEKNCEVSNEDGGAFSQIK